MGIPSWYNPPLHHSEQSVNDKVWELGTAAQAWANEKGNFPLNGVDVGQLMTMGAFRLGDSPFQRGGATLPYQLEVVPNATGPVMRTPRPGMIYYAVDTKGEHFWITGTGLPKPIATETVMIEDVRNKGPLVMNAAVEPPSPEVAPAKSKIETKK